jgi:CheY-like chemotaxis protein
VVDDNRDAADSLAAILRLRGHHALVAYDGDEAVAVARRHHVEVALLDINLPGADGYEVARLLRQQSNGRAIRFVAVTGFGTAEDRRRSDTAGFLAHLVKPIDHDRLLELLR